MNVIPFPTRDHEALGREAIKALLRDDKTHALRCLTTAWLYASPNYAEAKVLADELNGLIGNRGYDGDGVA